MELIEQCESDDRGERFEALEELGNELLHQGSIGSNSGFILTQFLAWIEKGHPDWDGMLASACSCAIELTGSQRRDVEELPYRDELFEMLVSAGALFERVLAGPCLIDAGCCRVHRWALVTLLLTRPGRAGSLVAGAIRLLQTDPEAHPGMWEEIERNAQLASLSNEQLRFCAAQTNSDEVRRLALAHLAARGDADAVGELRARIAELILPRFMPTLTEVAILTRPSTMAPRELLMDLFFQTRDFRAVHDLARAMLCEAAGDQREGWDVVSEQRGDDGMWIRHPQVAPPSDSVAVEALDLLKRDLMRNPRLRLIDTDLWSLFGL